MIKIKQIGLLITFFAINFLSLKTICSDSIITEESSSNATTVISGEELDNLITENSDNTNNHNLDKSANPYVWFPEKHKI